MTFKVTQGHWYWCHSIGHDVLLKSSITRSSHCIVDVKMNLSTCGPLACCIYFFAEYSLQCLCRCLLFNSISSSCCYHCQQSKKMTL